MPKKLTTEDFILRAINVHGPRYDYSKVSYVGIESKVCIICPIHGEFYQSPNIHIHNHGCPGCGLEGRTIKRRLTTDEFIRRANEVHGIGTYDYSKVAYIDWDKKVCIICKKHGEVWQRANFHLKGHGCYKCSRGNKVHADEFISRANAIHGAWTYDYSNVRIENNLQDKVLIICKKHGEFWQRAQQHLEHGCPICKANKGEAAIRNWLVNNKIDFKQQHTYEDLRGPGKRFLKFDFYIPFINLLIEYDGELHFCPMRLKSSEKAINKFRQVYCNDNLKNNYCSEKKIPLLRIPYKNYKSIPEIMKSVFGGPLINLNRLISFDEYGKNIEYSISDFLKKT